MNSFEGKSKDQLISELVAANEELKHSSETIQMKNTELVAAYAQIEENEILLNKTGEIAKVGGWSINLTSNTLTWTKEVYRIHELESSYRPTVEEAINFYDTESKDIIEKAVIKAIEDGEPFDVELGIITSKGNKVAVRAMGNAQTDVNGDQLVIGVFQDITERKQMEMRLFTADKMEAIGQLAGGIAHDFNNILGAIVGFSELILNKTESGSSIEKYTTQILKAGDRAKGLVTQILAFSRQSQEVKVALTLPPIIEEALVMLKASLPSSIELQCHCDENPYPVLADAVKINEIVLNLCTNAAYAMQQKGSLEISCFKRVVDEEIEGRFSKVMPGRYSVIKVKDSGCGMSKEVLKAIFEPFYTTKKVGEGTGMGLAVVFGIVQSFDGNVVVTSAVGQGSTFEIYLPATEENVIPEVSTYSDVEGGKDHILLIDDEEVLVEIFAEQLMELGYRVTVFNNSKKALASFQSDPSSFDLIITDQTMPRLTGMELARQVQEIKKGFPIILCTGYSKVVDDELSNKNGIKGLLVKPFRIDELADKIRTVLSMG